MLPVQSTVTSYLISAVALSATKLRMKLKLNTNHQPWSSMDQAANISGSYAEFNGRNQSYLPFSRLVREDQEGCTG